MMGRFRHRPPSSQHEGEPRKPQQASGSPQSAGKEILINVEPMETRLAILENGQLEEFFVERTAQAALVGNVYKGRVNSVVPGIRAAFVDLGLGKNGFLYLTDIVNANPELSEHVQRMPPAPPAMLQASTPVSPISQASPVPMAPSPQLPSEALKRSSSSARA